MIINVIFLDKTRHCFVQKNGPWTLGNCDGQFFNTFSHFIDQTIN